MIFTKKSICLIAFFASLFLLPAAQASPVDLRTSNNPSTFDEGLENASIQTGHKDQPFFSPDKLPQSIGQFFKIFYVFILGVAYFILMVYAGITWMTARGNEEKIEKAKNIIKNASIGLIIALMAFAIALFVIALFYGLSYEVA